MRPARVGLIVAVSHLLVTIVGAIVVVGAAFGASRPWAGSFGEQLVMAVTLVLLAPLTILNAVLPREHAPGWPVIGILLTSVAWGLAAYAIALWREGREAPGHQDVTSSVRPKPKGVSERWQRWRS